MRMRTTLLLLLVLLTVPALATAQRGPDAARRITVSGEASLSVVPDRIQIGLGIQTRDPDLATAKRHNDEVRARVMAALKASGVPDKSIQTDHLSIEPRWRDGYEAEGFLGYFVRNSLAVTVADAAKVDEVVARALEAGVTHLHGVEFQASAYTAYRAQARERALVAAREKAAAMAATLGQAVGEPLEIVEQGGGWWWPNLGWGYGRAQGMSQNVMQNAPASAGETPESVALGRISIRASVSVTFELVKR